MFGLDKVLDVVAEPAIECVKDKWNYIRNYNNYVKRLEDERKRLEVASEEVKHRVEEARNNAGNIEKEVEEWLKEADKKAKEAADVHEKKKQKNCFRGSICNPFTRYKIGKEAEGVIQSIELLETRRNGFGRIYYRIAPGRVTGLYKGISYYAPPSREAVLQDINKALMDSDVKVVGVYGPSGVGKSTLLTQVMERVHKKLFGYEFDEVAMATVSRDPDIEKIQGELACSIGLKFENEIGMQQRASKLSNRLSQEKKTLIILDDIWKKLDLTTLGISLDDGRTGIKLLLTSRSKKTLKNEMICGKNFELKALSQAEAMDLFKGIIGHQIEDASLLELVGREVVEKCACLPVYVVPLATKLKTYAPSTWKSALHKLRGSNKLEMNKLIEEALKDEEAKKLFLLCGQIGNQVIRIEDLLVYGMGLGLFKGINTIENGRERLKTLLENLKSFCFLEDYGDDYIKIHDVMSDVSLSMASRTQHSLVLRDGKELEACLEKENDLHKCRSISLPFVSEMNGALLERLKCPKLDMFLSYNDENDQIRFLVSYFEEMKELKVLDIFSAHFTLLPSSISLMKELQTLCLDRCEITNLNMIGQLKSLQVLTLRGCDEILVIPKEIGELTNLRLLDLSACYNLSIIEHDALGRLINLEELYLPDNFANWETKGGNRASLEELTGMPYLTSLTICIPNLIGLPHDFPFANLKRYKIVIKEVEEANDCSTNEEYSGKINPNNSGKPSLRSARVSTKDYLIEYDKTRTLRLKLDIRNKKIILEDWVQRALQSAQKLELLGWRGYEKSITELCKHGFSELKHVRVQNSPDIQHAFRPKDRFPFALLESLHLEKLINLEKIFQGNRPTNSFTNLKILRIKTCHKLQNLCTSSLAKGLSRIEEIEVSDCKKLIEIVAFGEVGRVERKKGSGKNIEFELLVLKLRKLVLSSLPQMSSFCTKESKARGDHDHDNASLITCFDGRQVAFPWLDSLALSELPKLRKISQGKLALQRVRLLEVKSCENLSNVLDGDLQLKELEVLTIENCGSMTTIFNLEEKSSRDLAQLTKLKLIELQGLKTIWPMNINIGEVPLARNLNQLEVSQCHVLTHLFSSSMIKSLHKISQITIDNCQEMKTIVVEENEGGDDIGETVTFSSLIELRISNMDSLAMFASGKRFFDFPRLKKLEISHCPTMSAFIPSACNNAVEGSSCSIKELLARACPRISKRKSSRTGQQNEGAELKPFFNMKGIFPSLEKLVLSSLGCLTSIWQSFPSDDSFCELASLQIEQCHSLEILVLPVHGQEDLQDTTSSGLQLESAEMMTNSSGKPMLGFPFLTNIKIDQCTELKSLFPDAIIRTLFELESLHISSCEKMVQVVFTQKEEMMRFSKLCSLKLEKLYELESFSTGSVDYYFPFLKELWILKCPKLKAFIMSRPSSSTDADDTSTPLFHDKVIIPNLEELHIKELQSQDILHDDLPPELFWKLKDLEVEDCHQLSTVIPAFILANMQSLETLIVKNCDLVRVIFEFEGYTFRDKKPKRSKSWRLKNIILYGLPQLEHICQKGTFLEYFPFNDLEKLDVRSCKLLKSIFTVSTEKILGKLQNLIIEACESMEQVVEYGQDGSDGGTCKIILHQLSLLKLSCLPMLSSFCGKHMTEWPSLVGMTIWMCPNVEAFAADSEQHFKPLFLLEQVAFPKMDSFEISYMENMKELWSISEEGIELECSSEAFFKLKTIEIRDCPRLSTIFPPKMVKGFSKLEKLIVTDCGSLEQVFQVQGLKRGTEFHHNNSSITLPFSLRELTMKSLPAMKHVWNIDDGEEINLTCDKLQGLDVSNCDNLKHLFPVSIARNLEQLDAILISDCKVMEEIVQRNDREHHQFVPNLKVTYLVLANLLELRSIPCKDCSILEVRNCPKAKVHEARPLQEEMCGGCDINPTEKVNILSSLKFLLTDMEGLKEMLRFLDGSAFLIISKHNTEEAAVERFPWKFLLEHIHNVDMLRIRDYGFEELFPLTDEEAQEEQEGEEIALPHLQTLRKLEIRGLPKLKQVWREDSKIEEILNKVLELRVSWCKSLEYLFQALPASFRHLAFIEVGWCDEMVYLLASSAARCLEQLTILEVGVCEKMEGIVREEDEDGNGGANDICFPRLKEVRLISLATLRSFYSSTTSTSCNIKFPSLESVSLEGVPKLEAFCKGGLTAPMLYDIDVSGNESAEASRLKGIMERELEQEG